MGSYSLLPRSSIKLEPACETDHVHSSAKVMIIEAHAFDEVDSASPASIKKEQPEEDVEYPDQESMGSYSLLPRSSIKLEPACETDHVHSSAKVMIIDAHAFDEVDSASPASIKNEQPEEDVEYPDQEILASSQNCPYLSMQEQLGTQELSDVLYMDKQQMFTKVIDMAGCSSDHEMTGQNNTVSRVTGNSSKASLEHENCSHSSQNVCSMLGSNTQISLTDKNCQLQNNMEVKTGDRQDMADVCDPEVSVDSCLSRHKRKDTEEEPFKYDLCGASFTSSGSLKFHMRTNTGEKPYQCDDCGALFARANSLKTHRRIHTGEKHYKYDDCGTVLTRANDLKIHKRRHTGEKPYRCEDCGEYFTESGSLTKHKRRHTGESPYRCDDCGAVFTHAGSLKTHKRIHTGEKPFKCDDYGESFNENSSLKKHKRTHTGERPFSCDDCGSVFTRAGSLKTHMRIHTGAKPYKCDDCGASFTQVHHLKRHKRTHTGKTPLRCENKLIDTAEKLLQV